VRNRNTLLDLQRVENDQAFVRGAPQKQSSANFYPADATRQEIEAWFQQLEGTARTEATGFFTTIRRDRDGNLISVPYSTEYQGPLAIAAEQLRLAARATDEPTLRHCLETRATAFATSDYLENDVAWMELDSTIEPTIGP